MGSHGRWTIVVPRISRWFAAMIALGAIVSALPFVKVPFSLAAVLGYASFGYTPANCGAPTSSVQALNGDVIHVCQDDSPGSGALFAGHSIYPAAGGGSPLTFAGPSLILNLPDQSLSFSCCASGSNGTGTYLSYTPAAFGPVTRNGSLISGAIQYSARYGATTYATIVQSASVPVSATTYQVSFAVTNTSGVALRLNPIAEMLYYGSTGNPPYDTPDWSTTGSPFSIGEHNPAAGGSLKVTSTTDNGSPAVSSWTAGSGGTVFSELTPDGTLDDQLHPGTGTGWPEMDVSWDDHRTTPLAAGATAHYTLDVSVQPLRDLQVTLHGAAPRVDAPTQLDAVVTDDRPVAGKTLRWSTGRGTSGSTSIDASGHATFTVPAVSGGTFAWAWVDLNGDGYIDVDEELAVGSIYAPPATPVAAPTPPPVAAPTPAPRPAPSAPPLSMSLAKIKAQKLATVTKSGLAVSGNLVGTATVSLQLTVPKSTAKKLHLSKGKAVFTLAHGTKKVTKPGAFKVTLKLSKTVARKLRHHSVAATLTALAHDTAGRNATATAKVTIKG